MKNVNSHKISFRVRYSETDQMGVVYHGKYADYLEIGRTEWLRNLGITYKQMEASGIVLPVVNLQINYKKPAKYDDLLTVLTKLHKMPMVKIAFDNKIYNESSELLVEAHTVLSFIDTKAMKPMRCPNYILEKLR